MSTFCPYSVRTLSILSNVITGISTSPLCASVSVHQQVVPFTVSPHLLNFLFIVSRMNIISSNRTYTVMYDTIFLSKLDLEKLLSVIGLYSVDASSVLCRFFVYFLTMFAWAFCRYSVFILCLCCLYYVFILFVLLCVFTGSGTSPLCVSVFVHP